MDYCRFSLRVATCATRAAARPPARSRRAASPSCSEASAPSAHALATRQSRQRAAHLAQPHARRAASRGTAASSRRGLRSTRSSASCYTAPPPATVQYWGRTRRLYFCFQTLVVEERDGADRRMRTTFNAASALESQCRGRRRRTAPRTWRSERVFRRRRAAHLGEDALPVGDLGVNMGPRHQPRPCRFRGVHERRRRVRART